MRINGALSAAYACAYEKAGGGGKTIVYFSNDLDKAMAAFIIGHGAATLGGSGYCDEVGLQGGNTG